MNHPNEPTSSDTPWEEAMSRDFDARVRDLHEAPLDVLSVKGKARKIRRNRRAAVAGGILGVAAIITPIAVLSNGGTTQTKEPDFADPSESQTVSDPVADDAIDYVVGGVWHQADGDAVTLPKNDNPYDAAVLWNDQLVATRWDGEVYSVADVIDAEGDVVDSFPTAGSVVVNDAGTTIAWVDTDGDVMTAWDGDQVSLGTADLAAPGETIAWSAVAITGGPNCYEGADGCLVYVNSSLADNSLAYSSHGIVDVVAPGVSKVFDAGSDGTVSVINEVTDDLDTCGGLYDVQAGDYRWETCDFQVQQISPDGAYVAGPQSQYDGIGPTELSILDAGTGDPITSFTREGWNVGVWAWSADGTLVFSAFDGSRWHLMAMSPDETVTELADAVAGEEFSNPFTLIQR